MWRCHHRVTIFQQIKVNGLVYWVLILHIGWKDNTETLHILAYINLLIKTETQLYIQSTIWIYTSLTSNYVNQKYLTIHKIILIKRNYLVGECVVASGTMLDTLIDSNIVDSVTGRYGKSSIDGNRWRPTTWSNSSCTFRMASGFLSI